MNASSAILRAMLARGDYLEQFTADELRAMLYILEQAHEAVLGKIAKTGGAWTQEWLQEIAADLDAIYADASMQAYDLAGPRLSQLAINEGAWVEATAKQIAMGVSFATPAPSLLSTVVKLATNIGGSTLEQMFQGLARNTVHQIKPIKGIYAAIQQGMLEGDTVDDMVRRLRGKAIMPEHFIDNETKKRIVGVSRRKMMQMVKDGKATWVRGTYKGGAMEEVTTRQAESLARTAVMHVSNQARNVFYRDNDDLIKGYQRVETLDTHTCLICGTDDGHVYKIDEPRPELPIHPDCRGVYVPVLKSWQELGIDAEELPPGTRASMDGQVAENTTWADKVAEAKRKGDDKRLEALLGPGRAQLYKQGVPLSDMVQDGEIVTIKELSKPSKEGAA